MLSDLIKTVLGFGLPTLATALGGPLAGAAVSAVAKAFGLPATADVATVTATVGSTANDIAIAKLKAAEAEFVAQVNAEASIAAIQLAQVGETIRSEIAEAAQIGGRTGRIVLLMQATWRPAMAWELLGECTVMAFIMAHEVFTGDFATLKAMTEFQGFLTWYYGLRFGLLGVYSLGRSAEKIASADANPDASVVDKVIQAVRDKLIPPVKKK